MERMLPQNKTTPRTTPKFLTKPENRSLFINWIAGLLGGLASTTIFSPLDLARTRHIILATTNSYGIVKYGGFMQTLNKIYLDEGLRGLYKGYCATAVTIPVFHSIYFSVFYRAKSYLKENWTSETRPVVRDVAASAVTGLIANTVTNPFWVVRTRIQSQFLHREEKVPKYTGLLPGLSQMYKEEGYRSLFKGLLASYLGLAHCIILFPLYEQLKTMLADPQGKLTNTDILIASNISKFIAMTATYPHIVVRARLQDHRTPKISSPSAGKEGMKMVDKY